MAASDISELSFRDFQIERLAIHELPRAAVGEKGSRKPSYSDIETAIDAETKEYLQTKLTKAFAPNRRYAIRFVESTTSNVRFLISNLFSANGDFIRTTQKMTDVLHQSQPGGSPEGLLLVMIGTLGDFTVALVTKLEKEAGTRARWVNKQKEKSIALDFLKEIILSQKTRLYKAAVFYRDNALAPDFEGFICDTQVARKDISANYFLRRFLGSELVGDAKVETRNFYRETRNFINKEVEGVELQTEYLLHLKSYMGSQTRTLRPTYFAQTYLKESHRERYRRFMKERGVQDRQIIKDITLVDKLEDVRLTLEDIALVGSAEAFRKKVKLRELQDGQTRAEVTGRLRGLW